MHSIGDTVLLEPIASVLSEQWGTNVYVISDYPELLENHPTIFATGKRDAWPADTRIIDMSDSIVSMRGLGRKVRAIPAKLRRMWEQAGLSEADIRAPRLYLSDAERGKAAELRKLFGEHCVAVVLRSSTKAKDWPYKKWLIKWLRRRGYDVFVLGSHLERKDAYVSRMGVHQLVDMPLREKLVYLSLMDVVVGDDTGPLHMAGALNVPTVVVTRNYWRDLWEHYERCQLITTNSVHRYALHGIPPKRVKAAVTEQLEGKPQASVLHQERQRSEIAIFRLDGLGGTLTVADQAKKIHEATGVKPDLIIRGYGSLFNNNPHVNDIVEVGHVKWGECMEEMLARYDTIAEIRFAPAKWHQNGTKWFDQDFEPVQELFDAFPMHYNQLEIHEKHQVQLTDWYLDLPEDTIEMEIFDIQKFDGLPEKYLVINNGVDVIHKDMRQTKVWNRWDELVKLMPIPTVQTGTANDPLVPGVIDIRGKYNLNQLPYIIEKATVGAFTEGGLMHLSYATGHPNIFILRGPTRGKLFEYPGQHMIDSYICFNCWYSTPDWYVNCPRHINALCMETITPERVAMRLQEAIEC